MAKLSPLGPFRAFDNNGDPLALGKLYTYEAGTSTPKATYTDASGDTSNANPVVLDSSGYANVWLGAGGYKFILKTAADATLWTIDDVGGDSENAFGASITSISTNTNVTDVYRNGLIRCTAALTLTLIAAATAEEGFYFLVTNASSGNVTIDPDGAETIDGASTFTLYPNDSVIVICNGTAWFTAFALPVSGITTNQISTSGSSGVVFKNSGGTTAMTVGSTNTTNVSVAGGLAVTGALSAGSLSSQIVAYSNVVAASIASASEIRSATASKLVDAAQLLSALQPYSTTSATTSGTQKDFTSIPAGVRRIVVNFTGVSSDGTGVWQLQIGDAGGLENSGYDGVVFRDGASTGFSSAFLLQQVVTATDLYSGTIVLSRGDNSTNTWHISGALSANNALYVHVSAGAKSLSAELTQLSIIAGGNNFDAGKITVEAFYT